MSSFNIKRKSSTDVNTPNISTATGNPLTSFGELNVAEMTPAGQGDFVYNINTYIFKTLTYNSGTVTQANGMASVNSGVNITVAIKTSGVVAGEIGINWFEQQ